MKAPGENGRTMEARSWSPPLFELALGDSDEEKARFVDQGILMMASDILVLHEKPDHDRAMRAMTFFAGARITTYHESGSMSEPIAPMDDLTATENALATLFRPRHRVYTPRHVPRDPRKSPRFGALVPEIVRRNPRLDPARAEVVVADMVQRRTTRLAWALSLFHLMRDASAHTRVNVVGTPPWGVYEKLVTRQGFVFLPASKLVVTTSRLKHQPLPPGVARRLAEALAAMPIVDENGDVEPTPSAEEALAALDNYLDDPRALNIALQTARMAAFAAVLSSQGKEGEGIWNMVLTRAGVDEALDFSVVSD